MHSTRMTGTLKASGGLRKEGGLRRPAILAAYGDCRHDGRMLRGTARKLVSSDRVGVALRGSGRAVKTPRHSLVVFCRVCD